ncbi:dihydropteroate synthase [Halomonas halocynthiae]|uniref:dihydropteroate synthase n=1 Tax=Halomonas halocynthiae TaxID=176290 RepID=UPI00040E36FD|nr:dihydropteroate synthase [Halomonas halocynthiae]
MTYLQCGRHRLDLSFPRVMGILNVTPDSFSDGGHHRDVGEAVGHAERMLAQGAAVIDVGGESTRPGAEPVSEQQELDRVLPVIERLVQELGALVSVDTSTPQVMQEAARVGAGMINDVRGLRREGALNAAASSGLPVCLMHMLGDPSNMQDAPRYDGPVEQAVAAFLEQRMTECEAAGLARERVILDPGFGFAKSVAHNLRLLNQLAEIERLGRPLLVGMSRKSMIGQTLGRPVDERLYGGLALAVMAVERGAKLIRVHDVQAHIDAIGMAWAVLEEGSRK